MPNKDSLVIQPSGEVISHTAFQSDLIVFDEEKRQALIRKLRQIPAFVDAVKKLTEGITYEAVFTPEGLERLKEGSGKFINKGNGLLSSTIRDAKSGQIIEPASLMEITPDVISSLNQLVLQQTLADIVRRLEVIEEKITEVLQGQFNDRLAEVKSGIRFYELAVAASDPDTRHDLLHEAIHNLEGGRSKLLESTDFGFIDKLPRNRLSMFFNLNPNYWNIPKHVQSKAEPVWKATHAIVEASRYMVLAFSALNEPDCIRVSLEQVKDEVQVFQDKMGEIVRWLPQTSNWRESLTTISQGVLPNIHDLDEIPQKTIVIEFQPKEISPFEGV